MAGWVRAFGESSKWRWTLSSHRRRSISRDFELEWQQAPAGESCVSAAVAVVLLTRIHCQVCPAKRKNNTLLGEHKAMVPRENIPLVMQKKIFLVKRKMMQLIFPAMSEVRGLHIQQCKVLSAKERKSTGEFKRKKRKQTDNVPRPTKVHPQSW